LVAIIFLRRIRRFEFFRCENADSTMPSAFGAAVVEIAEVEAAVEGHRPFLNLAGLLGIRDVEPPETPTNKLQEVRGLRRREAFKNDLGRRTKLQEILLRLLQAGGAQDFMTPLNNPSMF
jgi:hypothetical protein